MKSGNGDEPAAPEGWGGEDVVKNAEVERIAVGVWELRCFELGFMEVR